MCLSCKTTQQLNHTHTQSLAYVHTHTHRVVRGEREREGSHVLLTIRNTDFRCGATTTMATRDVGLCAQPVSAIFFLFFPLPKRDQTKSKGQLVAPTVLFFCFLNSIVRTDRRSSFDSQSNSGRTLCRLVVLVVNGYWTFLLLLLLLLLRWIMLARSRRRRRRMGNDPLRTRTQSSRWQANDLNERRQHFLYIDGNLCRKNSTC